MKKTNNGEHRRTVTTMEEDEGKQQMQTKRQTRGRCNALVTIISYKNSKRAERRGVGS
jgi:hypothetical protein